MTTARSTFYVYGKIFLIVGASFLVADTFCFILSLTLESSESSSHVSSVLSTIFGTHFIVWSVLGLYFYFRFKLERDKLKRLKCESFQYEAKIEKIQQNFNFVRVGSYRSVYAKCSYQNSDGKKCLVKSNSFLLENFPSSYCATVYVNRDDPSDYSVELLTDKNSDTQFDIDYT